MFLVTGCERSGTQWSSKFFTALGHPCGHEVQYNPWRQGPLTTNESSWLAVPFLDELPEDTKIIWNARDPFDMVESSVARGFLKNLSRCPYSAFVAEHRPDIVEPSDHLGRVIRYVAWWDQSLSYVPHYPFQLDRATGVKLKKLAIFATGEYNQKADRMLDRKVNTGPKKSDLRTAILNHPEGHLIETKARDWGYIA
jgi:hypothetical protein